MLYMKIFRNLKVSFNNDYYAELETLNISEDTCDAVPNHELVGLGAEGSVD
jgi:hypothetical protein